MHVFLSFSIQLLYLCSSEETVGYSSAPKIHKMVTLILKKRQGAFAKHLFLQLSGSLTLLHWQVLPTPFSNWTSLRSFRLNWYTWKLINQFASRIYKDLLNFKGQICKQVIPVNWWPVCCHQYPSGYRWLIFPNEETRERHRCSREAPGEFITLRLSFYCTGTLCSNFLATIPTPFLFRHLRHF